jgi:hypothetical protein
MDDRGFAAIQIPAEDVPIFREELVLHLRAHMDELRAGYPLRLAASLTSNDPVYQADVTAVSKIERAAEQIRVNVSLPEGNETFTFAPDDLHTWTGWSNARGEFLKLRKVMFLDYWNRTRPGDESLLE